MFAQYSAVISTIAIEIVVTTVVINFYMTWRGSEHTLRDNIAIRWFWVGAVNYFLTCLQCAFQVTLTLQTIIHFTDWVVGHAHLVMFGVFSFWIYGMLMHLWPKLTGREWWSNKLNSWHFWLSAMGLWIMFLDLMCGGLVQGFMWRAMASWADTTIASYSFWFVRTIAGGAILLGHVLLIINMIATATSGKSTKHIDTDYEPYEVAEPEEAAIHGTV